MVTRSTWTVGACVAASVAAGVLLGYPELIEVGVVGLAAMCASLLMSLRRPRIELAAHLPLDRPMEGTPFQVDLLLTNIGAAATQSWEVALSIGPQTARTAGPSLRPGEWFGCALEFAGLPRGVYDVPPAVVTLHDSLGLIQFRRTYGGWRSISVHPRVHELVGPQAGSRHSTTDTTVAALLPSADNEFHSLREYAPGDDRRTIHWSATAHLGTLVVRQTTATEQACYGLILDARASSYRDDLLDHAVRVAASLALCALGTGHAIRFWITDRADVYQAGPGAAEARMQILDLLATVNPSSDDDGVDYASLARHAGSTSALTAVTGSAGHARPEWWANLGPLFSAVTVVQLGQSPVGPMADDHLRVVAAANDEAFVGTWNGTELR